MFILFLCALYSLYLEPVLAQTKLEAPALNASGLKALQEGEILVQSSLSNLQNNQQSFDYQLSALHPQSCERAFAKLSLYEQFQQQMSFVKKSSYDEKTQLIDLLFDHQLMPFPIGLRFNIPRIKGPGIYDFTFNHGFFKGLVGKVFVSGPDFTARIKSGCLIQVSAFWQGADIGITPIIFNAFSTTLSKLGSEKLLRYSRF